MIDARTEELINADIDGELSDSERLELNEILENSAEAREFHVSLCTLDKAMNTIPRMESPATLESSIIDAVQLTGTAEKSASFLNVRTWPNGVRYGLAASIGLVFVIALFQTGDFSGDAGTDQMSGTMVSDKLKRQQVLDQYKYEQDDVQTRVSMGGDGNQYELRVEINSRNPVDLEFRPSKGFAFDRLTSSQSDIEPINNEAGFIQVQSNGSQNFAMMFYRTDDTDNSDNLNLQINIVREGAILNQHVLKERGR